MQNHKIGDLVLYYNQFDTDNQYMIGIIKGVEQWDAPIDGNTNYSYIVDWCDPVGDLGEYSSETIEEFKADLESYLCGMRVVND